MVGMREHARLENGSQVLRRHAVLISLGSENGEQIKNVEEQLAVQWRQDLDQLLVFVNGLGLVKVVGQLSALDIAHSLLSMSLERLSKLLIQIQWNHRLGKVVEVAPKNVSRVVHRVTVPNETLAISIGRVKCQFQFLDALLGAAQTKDAFYAGGCNDMSATNGPHDAKVGSDVTPRWATSRRRRTFFLQKDSAFCDNNWDISVNIALAVIIDKRDGHIGICDTLAQWDAKNALRAALCDYLVSDTVAMKGWTRFYEKP